MRADGVLRAGDRDLGVEDGLVALADIEFLGRRAHENRHGHRLAPCLGGGGHRRVPGRLGGGDLVAEAPDDLLGLLGSLGRLGEFRTRGGEAAPAFSFSARCCSRGALASAYRLTATDATPGDFLVYSLGGVDAARFDISQTGALTFKVAPNFELPTDAGLDKTYDVVVTVTDSFGLQASQSVAVTLTDVSEAGSGAPHISGYTAGSTSATLAATSTLADPDRATFADPGGNVAGFQWQMKSGASWVNIASPSDLSGVIARVTQSYADTTAHNPATDPNTISPETAYIGTAAGNILNGTAGRDLLLGLAGTDTLNGFGGDDTLDGGNGNDTLNGGIGADQMSGGTGDDTYTVDNAADVVFEATGAGTDRVNSSIDYTLTDNVERLYLTGSAITGTGNGLDNILAGNLAANKLFGGAGNDTLNAGGGVDEMSGGVGDDVYYVDNSADVVIEAANAGNDRVYSGADFTLGDNVDRLYMSGTAVNGTGNGLANLINGTAGHNVIKAGGGADVIIGGGGDDDLFGEDGNDSFIFGLACRSRHDLRPSTPIPPADKTRSTCRPAASTSAPSNRRRLDHCQRPPRHPDPVHRRRQHHLQGRRPRRSSTLPTSSC